jgi:hypothetical protein
MSQADIPDLSRHYLKVPKPRLARALTRKPKGAWRFLASGSPSSDGIHADVAGACRLMFGPPGFTNSHGVNWYSVEQRGDHAESHKATFLRTARGIEPGTPELYLWWWKICYPFEIKRPETISPITGHKVAAEKLTAAQEKVHPQFKKLGREIVIIRSRDEWIDWVEQNNIPHRRVVF